MFEQKLLDECEVETFRSSGKGGQHVNKTDSAVRLRHLPTGITVTSQRERSQYLNKQHCLEKLREKLAKLQEKKKPRLPTRPPKIAKEKTLKNKARTSEKKKLRFKPVQEDC